MDSSSSSAAVASDTVNPLLSMEGALQSAMKVKQAQMDRDRAKFLTCSRAMQNTLFHGMYGGGKDGAAAAAAAAADCSDDATLNSVNGNAATATTTTAVSLSVDLMEIQHLLAEELGEDVLLLSSGGGGGSRGSSGTATMASSFLGMSANTNSNGNTTANSTTREGNPAMNLRLDVSHTDNNNNTNNSTNNTACSSSFNNTYSLLASSTASSPLAAARRQSIAAGCAAGMNGMSVNSSPARERSGSSGHAVHFDVPLSTAAVKSDSDTNTSAIGKQEEEEEDEHYDRTTTIDVAATAAATANASAAASSSAAAGSCEVPLPTDPRHPMHQRLQLLMFLHDVEKKLRWKDVDVEDSSISNTNSSDARRAEGSDEKMTIARQHTLNYLRLLFLRTMISNAGGFVRRKHTNNTAENDDTSSASSASSSASDLSFAIDLLECGYGTVGYLTPLDAPPPLPQPQPPTASDDASSTTANGAVGEKGAAAASSSSQLPPTTLPRKKRLEDADTETDPNKKSMEAIKDDAVSFNLMGRSVAEMMLRMMGTATDASFSAAAAPIGGSAVSAFAASSPHSLVCPNLPHLNNNVLTTTTAEGADEEASNVVPDDAAADRKRVLLAAHAILTAMGSALSKDALDPSLAQGVLGVAEEAVGGGGAADSDNNANTATNAHHNNNAHHDHHHHHFPSPPPSPSSPPPLPARVLTCYAQLGALCDLSCNLALCYMREDNMATTVTTSTATATAATASSNASAQQQPQIARRDVEAEEVLTEVLMGTANPSALAELTSTAHDEVVATAAARCNHNNNGGDSSVTNSDWFIDAVVDLVANALTTTTATTTASAASSLPSVGSPPPIVSPFHLRASYLLAKSIGSSISSTTEDARKAAKLLNHAIGIWQPLLLSASSSPASSFASATDALVEGIMTAIITKETEQEEERRQREHEEEEQEQHAEGGEGAFSSSPSRKKAATTPQRNDSSAASLVLLIPRLSKALSLCESQLRDCIALRDSLQKEVSTSDAKFQKRFAEEAARERARAAAAAKEEEEKKEKERATAKRAAEEERRKKEKEDEDNEVATTTATDADDVSAEDGSSSAAPTAASNATNRREMMEFTLRQEVERARKDLVTAVYKCLFQPIPSNNNTHSSSSPSSSSHKDGDYEHLLRDESARRVLRFQSLSQQPDRQQAAYRKIIDRLLRAKRNLLVFLARRLFSSVILPSKCFRMAPFAVGHPISLSSSTSTSTSSASTALVSKSSSSSSSSIPKTKDAYGAWIATHVLSPPSSSSTATTTSAASSLIPLYFAAEAASNSSSSSSANISRVLRSATALGLNLVGPFDPREDENVVAADISGGDDAAATRRQMEAKTIAAAYAQLLLSSDDAAAVAAVSSDSDDGAFIITSGEIEDEKENLFVDAVASISNPNLFTQRQNEFLWESWEVRCVLRQMTFNFQFPTETLEDRIEKQKQHAGGSAGGSGSASSSSSSSSASSFGFLRRHLPHRYWLMPSGVQHSSQEMIASQHYYGLQYAEWLSHNNNLKDGDFAAAAAAAAAEGEFASMPTASTSSNKTSSSSSSSYLPLSLTKVCQLAHDKLYSFLGSAAHDDRVNAALADAQSRRRDIQQQQQRK